MLPPFLNEFGWHLCQQVMHPICWKHPHNRCLILHCTILTGCLPLHTRSHLYLTNLYLGQMLFLPLPHKNVWVTFLSTAVLFGWPGALFFALLEADIKLLKCDGLADPPSSDSSVNKLLNEYAGHVGGAKGRGRTTSSGTGIAIGTAIDIGTGIGIGIETGIDIGSLFVAMSNPVSAGSTFWVSTTSLTSFSAQPHPDMVRRSLPVST